ncbi:MAG: sigma 54-interacting transcriptional regulator [Actinomycetota bacterium]|nr:sigma 54-interacting transcriptional regulator [Actinomycetota bacterium]
MEVLGTQLTFMPSERYWEIIRSEWERFLKTGKLDRNAVRPVIASSWERSLRLGVDPDLKFIDLEVPTAEKQRRFAKGAVLREVACPFLDNLFTSVRNMELVIALMDGEGFVLDVIGEGFIKELIDTVGLKPGLFWTEKTTGTTAPTIALSIGEPVQVVAEEHWCEVAKGTTCAAAPIFGGNGEIMGILDISALYEVAGAHLHTYGMALAAAKAIETALNLRSISEELSAFQEYFNAAMQSISEGLIILNGKLDVLRVNRLASKMTGLHMGDKLAKSIRNGRMLSKIDRLLDDYEGFIGQEITFKDRGEAEQRLVVDGEPILEEGNRCLGVLLVLREPRRARKLAHKVYGAKALYRFEDLMGEDPEFRMCIEMLETASRSDSPVLISGESGTGKEMCAQALHNCSPRHDGPFIPLNCVAIPRELLESELFGYEEGAFTGARKGGNPGKFELADGGTLFLDEIDSMQVGLQAKLLRVIEEQKFLRLGGSSFIPVDVRIVAASSKDLRYKVLEGGFRDDLYYRLNVINVNLPPLRERRSDIPLLARHFLKKYTASPGKAKRYLKPEILTMLQAYDWPGNVRELSNWVERILTLGDTEETEKRIIQPAFLDAGKLELAGNPGENSAKLGEIEASHIREELVKNKYNISRTASTLGISRPTLYRKIAKYGIEK